MSSESTSLPLPLPADVDLSGMDFMPVFDSRLTKSKAWLRAKNWRGGGPGLGFCLFNLWIAAFRAVPAGSLEDDDDVLADAANCDIAYWTEIKDKALTGWQLAEGRWHHPVVSQICWGLWRQRLEKRHENALNSWRMVAKRAADKGLEPPDPPGSFAAWVADKYPASSAYIYVLAEQADARVAAAAERENGRLAVLPEPDEPSVELCGARALNIGPKVSKGKESPPHSPPLAGCGQREGRGKAQGGERAGQRQAVVGCGKHPIAAGIREAGAAVAVAFAAARRERRARVRAGVSRGVARSARALHRDAHQAARRCAVGRSFRMDRAELAAASGAACDGR